MYQSSHYTAFFHTEYNPLEIIAQSYRPQCSITAPTLTNDYTLTDFTLTQSPTHLYETITPQPYCTQQSQYISFTPQPEYSFQPDSFLKPTKLGKFVGKAEEIKHFIEQTFQQIFNQPFPDDIKVSVLDEQQFRTLAPHLGIIGLSINRRQQGLLSEIFIKNDFLARVMLTIGHELGHVLTPTLPNPQNEEAKAYAFSLAWMQTIKEHNIANLQSSIITENPAPNGLHDKAFFFVDKLIRKGKDAWQIYKQIIQNTLTVTETI